MIDIQRRLNYLINLLNHRFRHRYKKRYSRIAMDILRSKADKEISEIFLVTRIERQSRTPNDYSRNGFNIRPKTALKHQKNFIRKHR